MYRTTSHPRMTPMSAAARLNGTAPLAVVARKVRHHLRAGCGSIDVVKVMLLQRPDGPIHIQRGSISMTWNEHHKKPQVSYHQGRLLAIVFLRIMPNSDNDRRKEHATASKGRVAYWRLFVLIIHLRLQTSYYDGGIYISQYVHFPYERKNA